MCASVCLWTSCWKGCRKVHASNPWVRALVFGGNLRLGISFSRGHHSGLLVHLLCASLLACPAWLVSWSVRGSGSTRLQVLS